MAETPEKPSDQTKSDAKPAAEAQQPALESKAAESGTAAPAPAKKAAPAGHGPAKKKKKGPAKQKAKSVPWTTRLKQSLTELKAQVKEMKVSLRSPDAPTRRMAQFFFLSLFSTFVVLSYAGNYYYSGYRARKALQVAQADPDSKHFGEFIAKQAEDAKRKFTTLTIGEFTIELKKSADEKDRSGVTNMAEIEIVAECDSRETCAYIEEHMAQARNQITNVFTAVEREELLSKEGKRKLKRSMIDRMNRWLPDGKVENLFFSKLIIT